MNIRVDLPSRAARGEGDFVTPPRREQTKRKMIQRILNRTGRSFYLLFTRRSRALRLSFLILTLLFWFCLPAVLFTDPYSTVLLDRRGQLLGARISDDGQWRFPASDSVPHRFRAALITFEDRRFNEHHGVDPVGLMRAMFQNARNREVVSGGSTITMQVIRLARKKESRSIWNKMVEAVMATRLELTHSKEEILSLYVAHAPFGGNVVGLEAAAWRYFGRSAHQLSWAEAATLAVLPNSPSLVHPGRNRKALREKRDRLLDQLCAAGYFDATTRDLAKLEHLPEEPLPLPMEAPHLLARVQSDWKRAGKAPIQVPTSIDASVQRRATEILTHHVATLAENGIHNAAALIMDVETGEVVAYVGNVPDAKNRYQNQVDIITAPRSTGSILKPFLFAALLNEGEILPNTLVPDVPTFYGSWSPKNFNLEYDGAVPARRAIARSLNVPSIRMAGMYGQVRLCEKLKSLGMTTLTKPASHYGLSIILGGAETNLWDLAGMYGGLARTVIHYRQLNSRYEADAFRSPTYLKAEKKDRARLLDEAPINAGAAWLTLCAMEEVVRPEEEGDWQSFTTRGRIAWKTGTSYGFRDAWSVGLNSKWVVAVWVGNADGEGRPGLVGVEAAAPVMFELFDMMRNLRGGEDNWFEPPFDDLVRVAVCSQSGHRHLEGCGPADSMWVPLAGLRSMPCPYHKEVHLDATGRFQVTSDCESPSTMQHKSWFVLPPAQEMFYKKRHADYKELPPWKAECLAQMQSLTSHRSMEFIYPKTKTRIYVPRQLDGTKGNTVFEATHRSPVARIFWHLDGRYIGTTDQFHQIAFNPRPGKHTITIVDENGETVSQKFEVLNK